MGDVDGLALLIAGLAPSTTARPAVALSSVGEALVAGQDRWQVRHLAPGLDDARTPVRANLKLELLRLTRTPARVALVVIAGAVVETSAGPALVTGAAFRDHPDDATLSLPWIAAQIDASAADHTIALVSVQDVDEASVAPGLLAAMTSADSVSLLMVEVGDAATELLVHAMRGAAFDRERGAITLASLGAYLGGGVPGLAVRRPRRDGVVLVPPTLERLWHLGWSERRGTGVATVPTPREDSLIGTVLPGRFRVDALVAEGSFGTIYRARQLAVDRDVAVKVLRGGVDPFSEDGRLFVHEIQAVGRIVHPSVVSVHQADVTQDGRLFFAMELLAGRDLQVILDEGTLAVPRALELMRQLLAALEAAHEVGLVHADVKPANAIVVESRSSERLVLVDFGLARLRRAGEATESAGGTPAFMAPEQLCDGRVDARSDLFSAGLVLVAMLTGWRRGKASDLVPPLNDVGDAALREVLRRALALAPDDRYQSAAELAAALAGEVTRPRVRVERPPFPGLAAFTEEDRGRLYGRDRELEALTELALFRRVLVVTAPSGVGKTSLLRAGLVPRLQALGAEARYLSSRIDDETTLAAALGGWPDHGPRVLVVDQLESGIDAGMTEAALAEVAHATELTVVLSIREDFLARLLARMPQRGEGVPIVRLGPLAPAGARDAITRPLAERRISLEPELLDRLLADLTAAGARLAGELGWSAAPAVYPPHLQLACCVLHGALPPGAPMLTLAHYDALGGFDRIVGEHLERVLDAELDPSDAPVARDLFLALVTSAHGRSARTEAELFDAVGATDGERVRRVLEALRRQGLVVTARRAGGDAVWELIHDSLVPRVLGWIDRHDLARRRAVELVRYHLRRSRHDLPSLLSRAELREIDEHAIAVAALDADWRRQYPPTAASPPSWGPASLVARSRQVQRRVVVATAALVLTVIGGVGAAIYTRQAAAAAQRREASLRDRDMGRFVFELAPFDWDPDRLVAVSVTVAALPDLDWTLHAPDRNDPDSPGEEIRGARLARVGSSVATDGLSRLDEVEAPGGAAFLVVTGRGRRGENCRPSIVPLRSLPGYARRGAAEPHFRIGVPTCAVTVADTIEIPAGPFLYGGLGDPPSEARRHSTDVADETRVDVATFRIDRTEVTNAAFAMLGRMSAFTGITEPAFPASGPLRHAGGPRYPAAGMFWTEARAYCRFLGKDLPTSLQWEKSLRGGLTLPDGTVNPRPRRNVPWEGPTTDESARLRRAGRDADGAGPVAEHPKDVSPYGVRDLAGNVQELTSSPSPDAHPAFRTARGGYWEDVTPDLLNDFMAIENPRPMQTRHFAVGWRCATR